MTGANNTVTEQIILFKFNIGTDELSTVYTKDFEAPTEKSKCLFPVGKQWKFEKVKMYCFFATSDIRP